MKPMADLLKQYLRENNLREPYTFDYPLFSNRSRNKLTRAEIAYIVKKYADEAIKEAPQLFPDKLSPHSFRHYGERYKMVREESKPATPADCSSILSPFYH